MGETLRRATGAAPKYKFTPSGAPRSMKVSTIASPWRYDVAADYALQSAHLRRLRSIDTLHKQGYRI